ALRQEMMDIGDAADRGIFDRNHRELGLFLAHRREGIVEGGAGKRLPSGIAGFAGKVGIGAGAALKGDGFLAHFFCANSARALSRSSGVSIPKDSVETSAASICRPRL